jgi:hypothetical protein
MSLCLEDCTVAEKLYPLPRWGQEFSLLQIVQTGSEVHPTSYPMGTVGSFPGGKAAWA